MFTEEVAKKTPIMCKEHDTGKVLFKNPEDVYRPTSDEKGINNPTRLRINENKVKSYQEWINNPDADEPLPTIKKCSRVADGKVYHWELVDGFHRHTAMERSHVKSYWFRVVDHTDLNVGQIIGSQLRQNDHKDSEKLGVNGVANALSSLITKGYFGKKENITFNMLRTYLDTYLKNVRSDTKDRGIKKSLKQNGVPTDVNVLDEKEKKDFVNLNGNYKISGKMDKQRGALGWDCLEGYEDRKIAKALKTFYEGDTKKGVPKGTPSYFLCQVEVPSGNDTVEDARTSMQEHIKKWEQYIIFAAEELKAGRKPFWVENFFPQDNTKMEKDWIFTGKEFTDKG